MYQEVEKFFTAFFGEGFETSVLQAFFICFTLMLVYGILIRPFINLINGKSKKTFFDIITITLIILIGVKILYPNAFSFNINTDGADSTEITTTEEDIDVTLPEDVGEPEPILPPDDGDDEPSYQLPPVYETLGDFLCDYPTYVSVEEYPFYSSFEIIEYCLDSQCNSHSLTLLVSYCHPDTGDSASNVEVKIEGEMVGLIGDDGYSVHKYDISPIFELAGDMAEYTVDSVSCRCEAIYYYDAGM